jgi:hypothetical protein
MLPYIGIVIGQHELLLQMNYLRNMYMYIKCYFVQNVVHRYHVFEGTFLNVNV